MGHLTDALRIVLAHSLGLVACGCGGGFTTADTRTAAIAALREEVLAVRQQAPEWAPEETARNLLDLGESQFAEYFPSHEATRSSAPFLYRHYPETGTYLGVVVAKGMGYVDGGVYVMGGPFGDRPRHVGLVSDFLPALSPFVGNMGGEGNIDGTGSAARLHTPYGTGTDNHGNIFVADTGNHVIRKITPAGTVSTFAGAAGVAGTADGTGTTARFRGPRGVAVDSTGYVYVADHGNHTIRRITPDGVVSTLAGSAGGAGSVDGTGAAARFNGPAGVAIDAAGDVVVADSTNNRIRRVTPAGVATTIAGVQFAPGTTRLDTPSGVAIDLLGNIYVADSGNHEIRKITPAGALTVFAGRRDQPGYVDGPLATARFLSPVGVAVDRAGHVHVVEDGHAVRTITPAGVVRTMAGLVDEPGSADGVGPAAAFRFPRGLAADSAGTVYVADSFNHTIRKIMPDGSVSTLAGAAALQGRIDATGATARLEGVTGIAANRAGQVFVAYGIAIRRIAPGGVASTFVDATSANGMAFDSKDNLYVASLDTIRKITPSGAVSTFAGRAGRSGCNEFPGTGSFNSPTSVATDAADNVYVVENCHAVRKITPTGFVSTFAGSPHIYGYADGRASLARFSNPIFVTADNTGNVYVTESNSHAIRKITPTGEVSTFAGARTLAGSADGVGNAARFNFPGDLKADGEGNVYVSDTQNYTIRKITPAGVVTTVVGVAGRQGFSPGLLPGTLPRPGRLAISGRQLYVASDYGVAVVRLLP